MRPLPEILNDLRDLAEREGDAVEDVCRLVSADPLVMTPEHRKALLVTADAWEAMVKLFRNVAEED